MDPHASNASNEPSPYASRSANAPGNVSDIDRELEAYLEEKRGKGGENVDAQLAELRLKRGESGTKDPQPEAPAKDTQEKQGAPSYTAKVGASKDSDPNPHESLIRSLQEKYAQSAQEHNAVPASQNKQKEAPKTPETPKNDTPPAAPKSAPEDTTPRTRERTPQVSGRSFESVNSLRASLLEPATGEFESVLSALESLPEDLVREIVGEFEPKFARNKERKELFEKTKRDLEESLAKRVEAERGDQKSPSSSQHAPKPVQSNSNAQAALVHTSVEKTEQNTPNNKPEAKPKSFDVLDSQRKLSEELASAASPKAAPRASLEEKRADPAPAFDPVKPEPKTIEPQVETPEAKASTVERVKLYAEEKGLLTVLSYDPQKGFVRKPAHEVPGTVVSVEVDEKSGTARVEAKDAQGAVVSSTDVSLSDLN